LLTALGFDPEARARIVTSCRDSLGHEHHVNARFWARVGQRFKQQRSSLEALFNDAPAEVDREHARELGPGLRRLADRDAGIELLGVELRRRDDAGELVPRLESIAASLIHMHTNRMLHASHRAQELVIYDFLRRLYASRRARGRSMAH
jgi:thiopeptide-type bacteriocin biosynthesis protein